MAANFDLDQLPHVEEENVDDEVVICSPRSFHEARSRRQNEVLNNAGAISRMNSALPSPRSTRRSRVATSRAPIAAFSRAPRATTRRAPRASTSRAPRAATSRGARAATTRGTRASTSGGTRSATSPVARAETRQRTDASCLRMRAAPLGYGMSDSDSDTEPELPEAEPEVLTLHCPVCTDPYDQETTTKCGHVFCKDCITSAVEKKKECPICRTTLVQGDLIRIFL